MNVSADVQKRIRRFIFTCRAVGWFFVVMASGFIICGVFLLCDPNSSVIVNGVKRTDTNAKLIFVCFPFIHLSVGLFCALVPKAWLTKIIIYQMEQRRRLVARLPGPLRRFFGG